MQFVLSLLLLGAVVAAWAWVCSRIAARQEARPLRELDRRARTPRQRTRPGLPDGHRPPPGLGPLSPSERFLTQEAARGLREVQLFLAEQRTV